MIAIIIDLVEILLTIVVIAIASILEGIDWILCKIFGR